MKLPGGDTFGASPHRCSGDVLGAASSSSGAAQPPPLPVSASNPKANNHNAAPELQPLLKNIRS